MVVRCAALAAAMALVALAPRPAAAQVRYVDGFSRTRPILRPVSEAPTGVVRQIRFSSAGPGGATLYSAGDDKVVRRWSILDRPGEPVRLQAEEVIGWPIFRAIRGVIYAFDVQSTPQGDRLAFGGVGTKTSQVELLHADQPSGAQLLVDETVIGRNAVYAVAFRSDQKQLAVGHDQSPTALLWNLQSDRATNAQTINTELSTVWHLAYNRSGTRLAIAGRRREGWQVQVWDPYRLTLLETKKFDAAAERSIEILGLTWPTDDVWLVATNLGVKSSTATYNIGNIRAIAPLERQSGYAVGWYDQRNNSTQIAFWDGAQRLELLPGDRFAGAEVVIQQSPDGKYLAAGGLAERDSSGSPIYGIRLWRASDRALIAELPDDEAAAQVGTALASVGFVSSGINSAGKPRPYKIGFAWGKFSPSRQPPLEQEFSRYNRRIAPIEASAANQERRFDRTFVQGDDNLWRLQRSAADKWGPLPSWGTRVPKCYAHNRHFLALGYADGLLLCDLAGIRQGRGDAAVLRSYFGHEAQVTCMEFAPDGNLLISGSLDGTICGWRINDLNALMAARDRNSGGGLNPPSELATRFIIYSNPPLVTPPTSVYVEADPPPGSLGSEAGFRRLDRILELHVAGKSIVGNNEILNRLQRPVAGKEILAVVGRRPNPAAAEERISLQTPVSHDPLWTLYPQQDGDWVLWTPEGNFDAPPEMLDQLQWNFDLANFSGLDGQRLYEGSMTFRGRDFKELYFRPELIDRILDEHTPDPPQLAVIPPSLEIEVKNSTVTLRADPNGAEPISEMEIWLNSYRLIRLDAEELNRQSDVAKVASVEIPEPLKRSDGNRIFAVAGIKSGDATIYNRRRQTLVDHQATAAAPERRLHFLGVGVTKLTPGVGLSELRFPGRDAVELSRLLARIAELGKGLKPGQFKTLAAEGADALPTEENIQTALRELGLAARPDDLAIVFFSGHGDTTPAGYRFVAQDTAKIEASSISDVLINDALARMPCRTLLLLDTCHAEGVQIDRTLQDWPGLGMGPQILTSCDTSQESFEHQGLGLPGGEKGHGLFTAALLEALSGQRAENTGPAPPARDGNGDGFMSVDELCQYVKRRTEMLSDGDLPFLPAGKSQQTPKVLPSLSFADPREMVLLPLQ